MTQSCFVESVWPVVQHGADEAKTGGYITEKRKKQDFPRASRSVIHLSPSVVWCSDFSPKDSPVPTKIALHSSGHTWNEFLHHISSATNLLSAFCRKHNLWAMWGYIWSKWMLGCAPDLWSLVALLKLTWFHLGAQTPIWSNLETCTLSPHFKSCWGPSALKPERDLRGGVRPCPESLTSLPTSWNDVLQLPRLLRLLLPKNWGHYWNIFMRRINPRSRLYGQHGPAEKVVLQSAAST